MKLMDVPIDDLAQGEVRIPAIEHGIPCELMRGVYLLRMPMPFRLDHINLYALDDPSGWTLVDCGLNTPETMAVWESLFATLLRDKPVARIVVTHLHPDHIGLASWLHEKTRAPIYITSPEWEMAKEVFNLPMTDPSRLLNHYQQLGLQDELLHAMVKQGAAYRKLVKTLPEGVNFLREGEILRIGGRRWHILVGSGHSPACACLWDESEQVMISGDHILPSISPNINLLSVGPGNPLSDYLASLSRFRNIPCTMVLPAHGSPTSRYRERIDELTEHHEMHLERLQAACAEPHTAYECIPYLFKHELPIHQFYFAIGESAAHLTCLAGQGRLNRDGELPWRFIRP